MFGKFLSMEDFGNEFLGQACIIGVLFILCFYYYQSHRQTSFENSGQHCANPNCVRCISKDRFNEAIHDRMKNFLSDRESVIDEAMSDRLKRSFRHHLSVAKLETDFDNDYTMVGAGELQNPTVFFLQSLSHCHYFKETPNPEYRKVIAVMRSYFHEVKREFNCLWEDFVQGRALTGWQENSFPDEEGNWFTFHLLNQGKLQTENMERSPVTSKLLEALRPHVMRDCIFGFATFSVMMPGTHITSHCGATNIRARCHLGLTIPEGCTLTVNQEELKWSEGDCLMFDDSFQHEVHCVGDGGPRSVLMIDLWHPELITVEREQLNHTFHADLSDIDQ